MSRTLCSLSLTRSIWRLNTAHTILSVIIIRDTPCWRFERICQHLLKHTTLAKVHFASRSLFSCCRVFSCLRWPSAMINAVLAWFIATLCQILKAVILLCCVLASVPAIRILARLGYTGFREGGQKNDSILQLQLESKPQNAIDATKSGNL